MVKGESNVIYRNDEEIDLIQFLVELWKGKVLILVFILLGLLSSVGYLKLIAKTDDFIVATYKVNLYSNDAMQICGRNMGCLDSMVVQEYAKLLPDWNLDQRKQQMILKVLPDSKSIDEYTKEFNDANSSLTHAVLQGAEDNLKIIDDLSSDFRHSETVADSVLDTKRLIFKIENKHQKVMDISELFEQSRPPKTLLVIVVGILFGGFLGVLFVLVRKFIREIISR